MLRTSQLPENQVRARVGLRRPWKGALVGGVVASALLAPAASHAQTDVAPPLPQVLILLDSSGSMERMANSNLPSVTANNTTTTERTRWIQALEVLGGSIVNYSMLHAPRVAGDFSNEYGLGGASPYDLGYYLPHYRPLSAGCTIGSPSLSTTKSWPLDWLTWGVSNFGFRQWNGTSLGTIGSCGPTNFQTDGLGVLDTFRDQARFALMTFDTATDPKTGYNGALLPIEGMTGQWSYFAGWNGSGTAAPTYGWPAGCAVDPGTLSTHRWELGARNPSAPPWEGPLVPFATDDSTTSLRAANDRIRYAISAMRPYGATPLAPMLADAQYYFWNDPSGPKADSFSSCRGNFIILITDGFPNSDLRPSCENNADPKAASTWPACNTTTGGGGCCPTKRAQDITYDLANPPAGKPPVQTFVVGFALSDDLGAPVDCSTIDPASGICSSSTLDPKFKPCCTLHEMAYNGGTGRALLASDTSSLRAALIKAMSEATKTTSTSRTIPVFTGASSTGNSGTQYEFRSSFRVNAFAAWSGVLERVRWVCDTATGKFESNPKPIALANGDDFANNLKKQGTSRNFYTVDPVGTSPAGTIRPNVSAIEDGVLSVAPSAMTTGIGSSFVGAVSANALGLATTSLAPGGSCADAATLDECKQKFLNYALGLPQPKATFFDRVSIPLGDIYHATPVQVGPPGDFLRDESYTTFRNANATRKPLTIVATNDGLLHGFKSNVTTDSEASELWAFMPPAVLPNVKMQYGGAHALLLDAAPVVKDVAFGPTSSATRWGRSRNDARGGLATWRTVAVGGLTTGRGYYALDVTNPDQPQMLWQLTTIKDATGGEANLFGTYPGTPAIGTVYYQDSTTSFPVETPVAFLPGGEGTLYKTGTCPRWKTPASAADPLTAMRSSVRCWTGPGNSMTVVRLWDGKILRRFSADPQPSSATGRPSELGGAVQKFINAGKAAIVQDTTSANVMAGSGSYTPIDAPINGAVALYPAGTGTVTTRAFVGDADGDLWKLDVSGTDPTTWTFSLFHDAYPPTDSMNTNSAGWGPVAIPPVLSTDRYGDIVVAYATGDQNNFSSVNLNHVWSLTERVTTVLGVKTATPKVNWHLKLPNGNTPTGPMSLFSGTLFFSTFTPDTTTSDACLRGSGTIWGVDYAEGEPGYSNPDGSAIPLGRHVVPSPPDADYLSWPGGPPDTQPCPASYANKDKRAGFSQNYRCMPLQAGTIVFGAGVTQRPSCVSTPASGIGIDPYTGSSASHSTITDIAVGDFQLVAQTGPKATTSSATGGTTNTLSRKLTAPMSATRVDSWAAIVE
jgi:type IV pilus assembly protein PilY1